jgi:hypothetical protein
MTTQGQAYANMFKFLNDTLPDATLIEMRKFFELPPKFYPREVLEEMQSRGKWGKDKVNNVLVWLEEHGYDGSPVAAMIRNYQNKWIIKESEWTKYEDDFLVLFSQNNMVNDIINAWNKTGITPTLYHQYDARSFVEYFRSNERKEERKKLYRLLQQIGIYPPTIQNVNFYTNLLR